MNRTGSILVVDDTLESLKMMVDFLKLNGFEVRPANSGELALTAIASHLPDLVLLDIRMPAMDGFEVCRRLKADERTCDIPIIFLSAETDTKERVKGLTLGAVDFVSKPFQEDELLARIGTHLELRQLRQNLEELVAERTQELHQYRDHLEELVAARTAQLEALNKELESFSYSVSHDLRAPLRAINGYARILSEDHGNSLNEDGQRVVQIICREALRMGELIHDLLKFSRMGRLPLQAAPTNMTALAREVFDELIAQAPDRVVEFLLDELPQVMADAALLRQVWINLLDNALKYSRNRQCARIEVSGSILAGEAVYKVQDNGAGFDMAFANKLFGVFQRLHKAEDFEGTGVGLALVQRVVTRHGGRVWAESEPDQGATFFFTLPVANGALPTTAK